MSPHVADSTDIPSSSGQRAKVKQIDQALTKQYTALVAKTEKRFSKTTADRTRSEVIRTDEYQFEPDFPASVIAALNDTLKADLGWWMCV